MTLADSVRASGRRLTLQRQLVLDAVQRARHHVTADEIARRVRARFPRIGPSTVYRNRQTVAELGLAAHPPLDDRVSRWRRADRHPHGHLVCRVCGEETEIRPAVLD